MSGAKVDVRGILESAGADPDAPEGSQAWALAQVDASVAELIDALGQADEWIREAKNQGCTLPSENTLRMTRAALSNIGPQS